VDVEHPDYPAHWEADVLLLDGIPARLRPIVPSDAGRLVEFYARVSPESKYYRFFAPYPVLSDRDVERFTTVDHHDRVAFVVTQGSDIIAVGRFDRLADDSAEIAFLVEDAHQGRGLAQLLLEHLSEAGRETGVQRFVAEVLPDNARMIQTFYDAGYRVSGGFEDGVLRLVFPIQPTDTAVEVMRSRERRAEARSIARFFRARHVAVIGASRRADTIGATLVRNLVLGGFTGRVYVVNSAAQAVAGMPAYASVQDIGDEVDLAIVAVPAEAVTDVVLDCAAKGVHGLVVISSGFAETGGDGRKRQRHLVGLARSYGLRLVGPNCLGVINTHPEYSLNASLSPVMPPSGRVGFFCQSGALGVAILESVARRGLGLSTFVSAGNRGDVSGNDLLQYWDSDEDTEVVLLYLESIGNPRKFSRIARRVARTKPIVAVKSGRTTQGVPVGHRVRSTAAPQAAVDAMFRQAGVIQVETLDEMFDVAQVLAHQPLPAGNRVGIVGNSDALGLLAADAAVASGLQVTCSVALGSEAQAEEFEAALDDVFDREDVDAVVAVFIPPLNTTGEQVANVLAVVGEQSDKPLVSTFLGTEGVPELLRVPGVDGTAGRGSVPSYAAPEAAVRALARVVGYAEWRASPAGSRRHFDDVDPATARRIVSRALARGAGPLQPEELHPLLAAYGIDLWDSRPVASAEEAVAAGAELGWHVILKATAAHLRQRIDLSHVVRGIESAEEMTRGWAVLQETIDEPEAAGFVVQKQAPAAIPVRIGSLEDRLFGPIVWFGPAGSASELLGDLAYRIPPLTDTDAASMVREVRTAPLFFGYRGSEQVDVPAIEDLIQRVAQLKDDLPELETLDLELVLVGVAGASTLRASARVAAPVEARADSATHRLMAIVPPDDTLPS
jgi:acyl-CoA synthetase (NDP forming)/RimJ/RimL family protein N-acetyltransferase